MSTAPINPINLSILPSMEHLLTASKRGKNQNEYNQNVVLNYLLEIMVIDMIADAEQGETKTYLWRDDVEFYLTEKLPTKFEVSKEEIKKYHLKTLMRKLSDYLDEHTLFVTNHGVTYKGTYEQFKADGEEEFYISISWLESSVQIKAREKAVKEARALYKEKMNKLSFTKSFNPRIIVDSEGNRYKKTNVPTLGGLAKLKKSSSTRYYDGRHSSFTDSYHVLTSDIFSDETDIGFIYGNGSNFYLDESDHEHFLFYELIN